MFIVLFIELLCFSVTAAEFPPQDSRNALLPNQWNSITQCTMRYHEFQSLGLASPAFGYPAYDMEFAHMAAIGWTQSNGVIKWNCGGSLITENFILSAAHCAFWKGKNPDVARLGDLDLEKDDDDELAQQYTVIETLRHPGYSSAYSYHDIALLRLNASIRLHAVVCPACLWLNNTVNFKTLEAAGYGQTGFFESMTPRLLKVNLSPVEFSECSTHYQLERKLSLRGLSTSDHICASNPVDLQDTCPGDSGGPLQVKLLGYGRMTPFLVGVTSFGKACGTATPGVYTRIASYVDWIEEMTNQSFDPIECSSKYAEFREYEPDIYTGRTTTSGRLQHVGINTGKAHFKWSSGRYEHRVSLIPGNCAGTFIHEEYVLTAASCVARLPPRQVVSTNDGITSIKAKELIKYPVSAIFSHPSYRNGHLENDIALLKLAIPAKFRRFGFVPACIDLDPLPAVLQLGGITPYGVHILDGWSTVDRNKKFYQLVRSSQIPLEECRGFYTKYDINVTEKSICYGNLPLYILPDSCDLELGGPLGNKQNVWGEEQNFIMGVNSYGNDCGFGYPAVATKAVDYIGWIDSVVFADVPREFGECSSTMGPGRCVPASECLLVVRMVKEGAALNDFACDYEDARNPTVCCPDLRVDEECIARHEAYHPVDSKAHIVILDEASHCYGALIDVDRAITSARCAEFQVPYTAFLGCNKTAVVVVAVKKLGSQAVILKFKNDVPLSKCLLPLCIWTDQGNAPYELFSVVDLKAYGRARQRQSCNSADDSLGCAEFRNFGCESDGYELLQAKRQKKLEDGQIIPVPYLVGVGVQNLTCGDVTNVFSYEKASKLWNEGYKK